MLKTLTSTKRKHGSVLSDECEPISAKTAKLPLCRTDLTPLGESGGMVEHEFDAGVRIGVPS